MRGSSSRCLLLTRKPSDCIASPITRAWSTGIEFSELVFQRDMLLFDFYIVVDWSGGADQAQPIPLGANIIFSGVERNGSMDCPSAGIGAYRSMRNPYRVRAAAFAGETPGRASHQRTKPGCFRSSSRRIIPSPRRRAAQGWDSLYRSASLRCMGAKSGLSHGPVKVRHLFSHSLSPSSTRST